MALIVEIKVNSNTVVRRWCRRTHELSTVDDICSYVTDEGKFINHRYSDGIEVLAEKLLASIPWEHREPLPDGSPTNREIYED